MSSSPLPSNVYPGKHIVYNGYVYTIGTNNKLYKLSTTVNIPDGTASPYFDCSGVVSNASGLTIFVNTNTSKTEMFISDFGVDYAMGAGKIHRISDLDNPQLSLFAQNLDSPRDVNVFNGYLYVLTVFNGVSAKLNQYLLTDPTNKIELSFDTGILGYAGSTVIVGSKWYTMNYMSSDSYITQVDLTNFSSTSSYITKWMDLSQYNGKLYLGFSYNNGYFYFSYESSIGEIEISSKTITNTNVFPTLNSSPWLGSIAISNNTFYIRNGDYSILLNGLNLSTTITSTTITCFKEDTQILTDKGYKSIQKLRKGDLVKTLLHGYKAVDMIGKREFYHPSSQERIKEQLYKCSQIEYPEIIESLVITGCHSILVDKFTSEEQKQKVIEVNGHTFVTDKKYRLPVCADKRACVYEIKGTYTVYHFALENEDYYMNYGVYANGLLVESCSKRFLKELSNMTLIE